MAHIVFDIGGTKTRIAVASDLNELATIESFPTPANPEAGVTKINTVAQELLGTGVTLESAAGGIRGQLDEQRTQMHHDDLLPNWQDYPLVEHLAREWQCPIFLENDTALAALGEATRGAGKDFSLVVYHTISTGVGGAKVEYGWLDDASIGFEPGHQIIDIDRTVLGPDITPTLENLVSGRAVEERTGAKPYDIPQDDVLWDTLASYLGQGLRNTVLYWSPEVIILGGSMIIGDPRIPLDAIRSHTVRALDGFTEAPFITTATLGDNAGLYGALTYLGQQQITG